MNQMNGPTRMNIPGKNHSPVSALTGFSWPRRVVELADLVAQQERVDEAEDDRR